MATISAKIEDALTQVISDLGIEGLTVYRGLGTEEKQAPCAIVFAENVSDEAPNLGVWRVKVSVIVMTMAADTTSDAAGALAQQIFQAVTADDIKSTLQSKVSTLAVYEVICATAEEAQEGDALVQTLELEVVAVHAE